MMTLRATTHAAVLALGILALACEYTSDYQSTLTVVECDAGQTRDCGLDLGSCEYGQQSCSSGRWGPCLGGTPPSHEVCDRADNDCDGDVDEGFDLDEQCSLPDGRLGRRECFPPDAAAGSGGSAPRPATRCVAEGGNASGTGGAGGDGAGGSSSGEGGAGGNSDAECDAGRGDVELCDDADNDCDGDVDEGFFVGAECDAGLGCLGRRACTDDARDTACEIDVTRVHRDVCDGVDNDCDGLLDYTRTASGLVSACSCEGEALSFGDLRDASISDDDGLCEPRSCTSGDEFSMEFCLACSAEPQPYAMCEGEALADLSAFDRGEAVLSVTFTLDVDGTAKLPVDLYYQSELPLAAGGTVSARKYLRLASIGTAAGTHTREFLGEHACSPEHLPGDCRGDRSGSECPGCQPTDTCGLGAGSGCDALEFRPARLQLAVEFCPDTVTRFQGRVRIDELAVRPLECLN